MKKICLTVFFVIFNISVFSLDTGISSKFGNYGLSDYDSSSTEYISYFQWGVELFYFEDSGIENDIQYGFIFERDAIKGYSLSTEIKFMKPFYSISFGPIFGVFNESMTVVKPGFSGQIRGEWPGYAFIELGGDVISAQYNADENDYSNLSAFYTFGFYLKQDHILCYFTQQVDNYTSLSIIEPYTDRLVSYAFYANFFKKRSIFKIESKLGYEILSRTFFDSQDIELRTLIFGLKSDFYINPGVTIFLGVENKIYPLSKGSIELSHVPLYQVTVESGFAWSL